MEKEYLYLVYLLKCALNKEKANTTNLSYYDVFDIACKHSIAAMTFESVKDNLDASLYRKWEEVKNKAIAKDIYQRAELIKLIKLFEDENIRCMPLKGTIMKNYYPYTYFREMADLDICIDSCNREKVKKILINRDYIVDQFGKIGHDVYFKKPIYNIEIHDYLINRLFPKLNQYFKDGFSLAKKQKGNVYYLSNEDFYLHLICHAYKHFYENGTGIRSVLDIYVFRKYFKNQLNEKYIKEKVKLLEIEQFEKNINQLSLVWFECEMYNQYVKSFEKSIFDSGTYGSKEVYVNNIYKRNLEVLHNSLLAKIKLYWSRIFPKILYMRENFPILEKFIILLPFCYIYRILNAIVNKRNVIKKEIKLIKNAK